MESTVVSISRTLAAGGEEIGRLVARELDFRYVDDEIMSQSLITRILEAMETGAMMEGIAIAPQVAPVVPESRLYQNLIKRVIHGTAEAGKVVFVAHGTSVRAPSTSACSHHLDEVHALLHQLPHCLPHTIYPVGLSPHRPAVASGNGDRTPADDHSGPWDESTL